MQNILINMSCVKSFDYDRLRNDRVLQENVITTRTPRITRTTFVAIGHPFPGPEIFRIWKYGNPTREGEEPNGGTRLYNRGAVNTAV